MLASPASVTCPAPQNILYKGVMSMMAVSLLKGSMLLPSVRDRGVGAGAQDLQKHMSTDCSPDTTRDGHSGAAGRERHLCIISRAQ